MANDILQEPLGGFKTWHISQIYFGEGSPEGTIVPNVGDAVIDWDRGIYEVVAVVNQIPTLELFDTTKSLIGETNPTLIGGLSDRNPSVLLRAFFDGSQDPSVITIDDQYRVYGSELSHCKLFLGRDINPQTGTVISRNLSGSSENVTYETIDNTSVTIKRPNTIYTHANLDDGEVVTLVNYSSSGVVTGEEVFVVKNTNAIRSLELETVYIVDIELVSSLLSESEPDVIEVPFGQPLQSSGFDYRLLYSDGTTQTASVDGVKARLSGLDNYNTNWAGDGESVVLLYTADPNEPIINVGSGSARTISKTYTMVNVDVPQDAAYKIYMVPRYAALTQTYELETLLVNAAHDWSVRVDPSDIDIYQEGTTNPPDLTNSGAWQQLDLAVDIGQWFPSLAGYTFTQTTGIRLGPVNQNVDNKPWLIDYRNDQQLAYGNFNNMKAIAYLSGNMPIDIKIGATTVEEWLERLYDPLKPSYDDTLIGEIPTPTHFALRWWDSVSGDYITTGDGSGNLISVDDWNINIDRLTYSDGQWENMETLEILWYYTLTGDVSSRMIGVSPIMVHIYQGT